MYTLLPSLLFDNDIDSVYQYISENLEAPRAAENLMKELKAKLNYLKENPFARSFVQDEFLANIGFRPIKVKNYIIYYIVDEVKNEINLIRSLYKARDWINILKEESEHNCQSDDLFEISHRGHRVIQVKINR